jgi:hypothetical protein
VTGRQIDRSDIAIVAKAWQLLSLVMMAFAINANKSVPNQQQGRSNGRLCYASNKSHFTPGWMI